MPLKLTLTSLSGGDRQERTLSKATLSIGRGSGNDWVLADPDQHLSRTHCMIGFEQGQYWLTDMSTNGMLINDARTPTQRDSRTVLMDGDSVVLGGYKMLVAEVEERAASPARDPFGASGARDFNDPLSLDPLADPLSDPLDAPSGGGRGFHHPVAYQAPPTRAADPFDRADENDRGRPRDPDQDLFQGHTPVDPWKGATQRDDSSAVSHAFSAPRNLATPPPPSPAAFTPTSLDDIDFDALLGDVMPQAAPAPGGFSQPPRPAAPAPSAPMAPPMADPFDELLGDMPAPTPPAPPPPPVPPPAPAPIAAPIAAPAPVAPPVIQAPPPPMASPTAPPSPAPGPALIAAFYEGAGLPMADLSAEDQEAAMRAMGALFRAFVTGTRDVLMSRAEIKHEMRVEQTMIRSKDNNALKFSISPEEALQALLRPNRPGYKQPLAAVEEAFDDIRSHELAVMAGMQTGLMALLKRFDPALLEARLQKGMLDGIMPSARKARFWEMFCATYKDIAREAEDDFHALFGREFAKAYSAQVNKL